ncbi:MAG: tRNA (guanosine(46)-N7)-methyltransferase TrmB, partial [Bacteroidota bacterium]
LSSPPMGQKKRIRFEAIKHFPNVLEYPRDMQGKWNSFFKNEAPVTLELACGKGEYAVGLGRLYTNRNFIGIDIKGNRIWRGAKTALDEGLANVAFIRSHIDKITDYFSPGEVSEIWITFPDPQLRGSRSKKRLTHPGFLRLYQKILQEGGLVHLKTDSPDLYQFTLAVINLFELELLEQTDHVYEQEMIKPELLIKTHYESLDIAQSNRIHYICFRLNKELPLEKDDTLKQLLSEPDID